MKIGNIEFGKYPLFLAPMEDVTDPAFRQFCKRFGKIREDKAGDEGAIFRVFPKIACKVFESRKIAPDPGNGLSGA